MLNISRLFISTCLLCYGSFSVAGGPLVLQGPDGTTPVNYENPVITVNIETGDLGSISNSDANNLVQDAFNIWNSVSTSTLDLNIDPTPINEDIDVNSFQNYIPFGGEFHADDNLNPIIYDSDGAIIDALFGNGASDITVGFAASIITIGGSHFEEGYAVINGKPLIQPLTLIEFKLLIAHEIGHFFGLDHTQVDIDNGESEHGVPGFCQSDIADKYPVMYPFICRDTETLHADDNSAVSALYPAVDINSSFGVLQGRFLTESGHALLGANLWAENTASGETYSIVSDYLTQNTGYFKLLLPAGNYLLKANSINPEFNGGSGIGPYSDTILSESFIEPHPIEQVTYQGAAEGGDQVITLSAGQMIEINFSTQGIDTVPAIAASNDDDSIADLFGSTSLFTLLIMLSLILLGRSYLKKTI